MAPRVDEAQMALALADVGQQAKPNYAGTAKKYGLARVTLYDRYIGKTMSAAAASSMYHQRLTNAQEEVLIRQINYLTNRGLPPTSSIVKNMAEEIIGNVVGKNWTGQFVKRHQEKLLSVYLRNMDKARKKAEYVPIFKRFYEMLYAAIEKYNITADNMYNWDEKGFLIGLAAVAKRIMSREAFESGRIRQASQDGSREFISLLACISAAGKSLPPALIYKGSSGDLQDIWLEDWVPENLAYFAASPNGWSSDALGLQWLKTVFDRHTRENAGRARRLLIVDGHSSHVNLEFIRECDKLRILVMILPPHSTHRLQPLDVSLFSPLSTFYSKNLHALMHRSLGLISMSKRSFWSIFWPSWQQAFTEKNIASGYTKTGIWPYNPNIVIEQIKIPTVSEPQQPLTTPMTSRTVRRIHKVYRKAPSSPIVAKILRANDRLAAQHEIDQHVIRGLIVTVNAEKNRRKRGEKLNLVGEEDSGPQFYSPGKIQAAIDLQTAKEAEEAQKEQNRAEKRVAQAANKVRKEAEKVQREIATAQRKVAAAEARAQKDVSAQLRNETREAGKRQKAQNPAGQTKGARAKKQSAVPPKAKKGGNDAVVTESIHDVVSATTRTRSVKRPVRFAQ